MNPSRTGRPLVLAAAVMVASGLVGAPAQAVSLGEPATTARYGFVAKLQIGPVGDGGRSCTGALVASRWVLTAKSCFAATAGAVSAGAPPTATTVTVGRPDLTQQTGVVVRATELLPHPDRDVVLVRFAAAAPVTPAVLSARPPVVGDTLTVAGFGRTATEWVPQQLHAAPFTVSAVAPTTLDIDAVSGASTCKGDSGGPALLPTGELVAIHAASWQRNCLGETSTRAGSVETRVDDIRDWIEGHVAEPPAKPLAYVRDGEQHIFARSADSGLHHWSWIPGTGRGHDVWATGVGGDPTGYALGSQLHAYARGTDGRLYHWVGAPGAAVRREMWADAIAGNPTSYATATQQHVYARGTDGRLYHWVWQSGSGVRRETWGEGVAGDPVAYVAGGAHHVWARDTGGQLRHWVWESGQGVRQELWTGGLSDDPGVYLAGSEHHILGRGDDGRLQHWSWITGTGRGRDIWGDGVIGDPGGFAVGAQRHAFARGTDGKLHHWVAEPGRAVVHEIWAASVTGDPIAYVLGTQQHVWSRGPGGKLHHWARDTGQAVRQELWDGAVL